MLLEVCESGRTVVRQVEVSEGRFSMRLCGSDRSSLGTVRSAGVGVMSKNISSQASSCSNELLKQEMRVEICLKKKNSFFETRAHCIALVGLELTLWTWLDS